MEEKNYKIYEHIFPNGKIYIGMTCQKPERRWNYGKNYKSNIYMFNAIQKYGWDNIKHKILYENLSEKEAEQKEIELIAKYKSNNRIYGYNIENGGNHNGKINEEIRHRLSESHKGQKVSLETREKISKANKGKKISLETRMKISIANKGRKLSNETRQKLSKASKGKLSPRKGKKMTEEQKRKISNSHKGKPTWNKGKHNIYSKEAILKMSESHKGKPSNKKGKHLSEETKQKISNFHKGKKLSKEHKKRISKSLRGKREGMKWINNKINNKIVLNKELDYYLNNGWKLGLIKNIKK